MKSTFCTFLGVLILSLCPPLRGDVKSPQATLIDPPTKYQPGGATSYGDTYMHAWGSLPNSDGSQPNPMLYVDYVTNNDGSAWNTTCGNIQNITVSYFANATALTTPTVINCMTDFGQAGLDNGTPPWGDGETWKSAGMLAVNGVLYLTVLRQQDSGSFLGNHASIMKSLNGGRSWCFTTASDCKSASNNGKPPASGIGEFCDSISGKCSTNFVNIHFVQYERDGVTDATNKDGQDTYIYGFASDSARTNYYLMRILRTSNLQLGTDWQYYTGPDGGSVSASSNWAGFGTSGSGKPVSCAGSTLPDCGATIVFTNGTNSAGGTLAGSSGGPIWVGSDFGYLIGAGNNARSLYLSQNLTGDTGGKWRRVIYAANTMLPAGWSDHVTPLIDDFPEPVLSTVSVTNAGGSDARATLVLSSSGDYKNGDRGHSGNNYAMFTASLTLYKAAQMQNFYCTPATALPGSPKYEAYFGDDTYNSAGQTAEISDQSGNYSPVAMPAFLYWTTLGVAVPRHASSDVFLTPYTPDKTGDFTMYVVYNRSLAVDTGTAYERIVDKSDGAGGLDGFTIQRQGTTANTWCVFLNNAAGGCDTGTTDQPDGQTNMLAVRRLTTGGVSTLSMWNSKTSPTVPLLSYNVTSITNPAATTTGLRIGNSFGLSNAFEGSTAGFVYYSSGLSNADAATAQTALQDKMYCAARNITLPGVTGNH
jgi:hypothetical protein